MPTIYANAVGLLLFTEQIRAEIQSIRPVILIGEGIRHDATHAGLSAFENSRLRQWPRLLVSGVDFSSGDLMGEVASLLLGFLLGLVPPWFTRRQRLKAHWWALRAELAECREKAETLLSESDRFQTPLYRLPTNAFQVSFPIILADCAIDESEARALTRCFSQIQDINRGLDNAAEFYKEANTGKLHTEHNRNCLKARALIEGIEGKRALMTPAKEIIDRKVALPWWKLAKIA